MILASFAGVVGVLTDRQVTRQFYGQLNDAAQQLVSDMHITRADGGYTCNSRGQNVAYDLSEFAKADAAQIRVFDPAGNVICSQLTTRSGRPLNVPAFTLSDDSSYVQHGYQLQAHAIRLPDRFPGTLIYGRQLSSLDNTINKVRLFLVLGVFGGTLLALLAGLTTAQRAIRPIAQLTDAAREIERTRDPSRHVPHPRADDEVAELARTLEGMLAALDASRSETEAALRRQREFVADASHELRTPLTSVLANLELLADELQGEPAESAKAALRSTRRMRRLVGDLLLLARADAERQRPARSTDLSDVLLEAAGELGAVAEDHHLTIDPRPAMVKGSPDDLHRLVLNLLENAVRHTPPGTHIRARTSTLDGAAVLVVEDDGPGIPGELQRRVFDRFVRGGGDSSSGTRGTGLGLAIVRAVAESHGAKVDLGSLQDGTGTRFVITFGASTPEPAGPAGTDGRDRSPLRT